MARENILLLDSDRDSLFCYRILLADHSLWEASSLAEALSLCAKQLPDVIVTEWHFADGCAAPFLQLMGAKRETRLRIIHTAASFTELNADGASALADHVLQKPAWARLRFLLGSTEFRSAVPRRHPRFPLAATAFVRSSCWQTLVRVRTIDLSEEGVALSSFLPAMPGAEVRLVLMMPDGQRVKVTGEVRYSTPMRSRTGGDWRIGIRWREIPFELKTTLRAMLRPPRQTFITPPSQH
jgi:hypothetical protein